MFYIFLSIIELIKNRTFVNKKIFILIYPILFSLIVILYRALFNESIYLKDILLPFIQIKMLLFLFSSLILWKYLKKESLFKFIIISVIIQLIIATLQKLNIPLFSNGLFYNYAVYNAMSNVYYGGNIDHIINTHLKVTFRPIGFIGSPTILATYFLVIFSLWNIMNFSKKKVILIGYSLLLCFSKITILSYIIYNFIVNLLKTKSIKKILIIITSGVSSLLLFILFLITNDRIYNYFIKSIDGSDYGVTHRKSVLDYISNLNIESILFGIGGEPPFIFDSGTLLTIFRFGIVYLLLIYYSYYILLKIFSVKNSHLYLFLIYLFADMTIGVFHNQMFFYLISFSILYSKYIKEKNEI
uniref:Wzy n=1 Tax=Proteus vulgaris TaxID=585 RepID=A0A385JNE0_PROVU|nr:wzy [Proteus vulgaris]